MDFKKRLKDIPNRPGVYLMKDKTGNVIYVGKAASLKKRIQSYFSKTLDSYKTQKLTSQIKNIDYICVGSEAQALLLESNLIKQYQPRYNVSLRDDKSYPSVKITADNFPAVFIMRPKKKNKARYFGPYTNARLLRKALKIIRRVFPFRSCRKMRKNACLDYHLKLCPAPCIGKISKTKYQSNIKNICLILEGRYEELINKLYEKMQKVSLRRNFEEAAKIRDQIQALASVYMGSKFRNYIQEMQDLKDVLGLSSLPRRIEAFDISNIFGNEAVGSMVSFYQGKPDKNNYRRFRIKDVKGIDDYKMLAEVLRRRYTRLKNEKSTFPNLIVIDGGKGQVSVAKKELKELNLDIPVMGIAKQKEEFFYGDKKNPIILDSDSLALALIKRIRDEAHRFALAYHHILRRKKTFEEK